MPSSHGIQYYSTNRALSPITGITPLTKRVTFKDALFMGQAPDEGLFMPDTIPQLSMASIMDLKGAPYTQAASLISEAFLALEIPRESLDDIVHDSYDFLVPLENVYDRKYIMRLDQGPTASFKDFAARMMARLMRHYLGKDDTLQVLVATSGDTGSAVGEAFKGVQGINVYIVYPAQEVSLRQKKQIDSIGSNVTSLSIDGKFDDCQDLVKTVFADKDFQCFSLTSANSINVGRIIPQIIYYVYSYSQLAQPYEEIIFSIPSGNFGNALGCEYARRMGLPVKRLIIATNENDEFPRFLKTGSYTKMSPSRSCLSNAMNVGHPSNLARFFDLYGGTMDRSGTVYAYPDIHAMKRFVCSYSVTDEQTRETIRSVYKTYGTVLEPHGAVGWKGLDRYLETVGDHSLCVALETAHPAKFPDEIEELLNLTPTLPTSMIDLDLRTGTAIDLPNDYGSLKEFLLQHFTMHKRPKIHSEVIPHFNPENRCH